jgi:hypothetical protein
MDKCPIFVYDYFGLCCIFNRLSNVELMQDLLLYISLIAAITYLGFKAYTIFFKKEKSCGNGSCGCD